MGPFWCPQYSPIFRRAFLSFRILSERSSPSRVRCARAKSRRALDGCGPFRRKYPCDGRLRREDYQDPAVGSQATMDQRSTGRSSRLWGCTTKLLLPMCHLGCFEAGRFPQIQSSWTVLCCSRKWMSGPADDALTLSLTDRIRSIVALTVRFIQALQILLGSAGRSAFSLGKYLSWMPHKVTEFASLVKGRGPGGRGCGWFRRLVGGEIPPRAEGARP